MNLKKNLKYLLSGTAALAVSMALTVPASAMPSDIREGIAHEQEAAASYYDDSDLLEDVGSYYVATGAGNVREYPNGPVIDVLTPGDKYYVNARRTDIDWYQISGYSPNAYVYTTFLIPQEEYLGTGPEAHRKPNRRMTINLQSLIL